MMELISNKYSLVSSDGIYVFLSDDEQFRIVFVPSSTNTYTMTVYNILAGNKVINQIRKQDWYIGSEVQQYDSTNMHCKEFIDENFALKSEIEELKTTISSLEARLTVLENR